MGGMGLEFISLQLTSGTWQVLAGGLHELERPMGMVTSEVDLNLGECSSVVLFQHSLFVETPQTLPLTKVLDQLSICCVR